MEKNYCKFGEYFYGNKISDYGLENGFVDYGTLAKAFDAVLNNEIMNKTYDIGYWEQESGMIDNSEEIDDLEEQRDDLEEQRDDLEESADNSDDPEMQEIEGKLKEIESKLQEIEREIDNLKNEQDYSPEVFQWYIVSDQGAEILKEFDEIIYYNEELDMYLWGVTHWGTRWDYVLTDIPCEKEGK